MEVIIDKLGINGEGVFKVSEGELAGKVGFVSYALPGEKVNVKIIKNKSSFCQAELVNINCQSNSRIQPKCPYFYECGGCDLQHMNTETQLNFKSQKVKETIGKIAKINDISIQIETISKEEVKIEMEEIKYI